MKRRQDRFSYARRRCALPSCAGGIYNVDVPFCKRHWHELPEDIRERVQWASGGESMEDYRAALHAAVDSLQTNAV